MEEKEIYRFTYNNTTNTGRTKNITTEIDCNDSMISPNVYEMFTAFAEFLMGAGFSETVINHVLGDWRDWDLERPWNNWDDEENEENKGL